MIKVAVIFTLGLFGLVAAQVISSGSCPADVQVLTSLDVSCYLGLWYEYAKYPAVFETNGKCITAQYSLNANGSVAVNNTMVDQTTRLPNSILGSAVVVEPGKLKVTFPTGSSTSASTNYWVLDTDYTSYSVVFSCQPISSSQTLTFVWILTRQQIPSQDVVRKAQSILLSNGISLEPLVLTDQSGCDAISCR